MSRAAPGEADNARTSPRLARDPGRSRCPERPESCPFSRTPRFPSGVRQLATMTGLAAPSNPTDSRATERTSPRRRTGRVPRRGSGTTRRTLRKARRRRRIRRAQRVHSQLHPSPCGCRPCRVPPRRSRLLWASRIARSPDDQTGSVAKRLRALLGSRLDPASPTRTRGSRTSRVRTRGRTGRLPRPDMRCAIRRSSSRNESTGLPRSDPIRRGGTTRRERASRHLRSGWRATRDRGAAASFRSSILASPRSPRSPDRRRARARLHPPPDSDLGVVQHMVGHEDIHTTEAYYGHYDLSDLERAMEQFASRRSDTVDDPN